MSSRIRAALAAGCILAAMGAARASAPLGRPEPAETAPTHEIVEGEFTLAPMGYIRFCIEHRHECAAPPTEAVEATPERLEQLRRVNLSVNRRIAPRPDRPGNDVWSLNVAEGDCDDYAVQKRHDLARLGWPPGALLLAAARTPGGENHLVLVARTQAGNLVLDNLRSTIVPMEQAKLHWLKMQSTQNPAFWVDIRRTLVAKGQRPKRDSDRTVAAGLRPAITVANDMRFAGWTLRAALDDGPAGP